jgi:hypothetical protein
MTVALQHCTLFVFNLFQLLSSCLSALPILDYTCDIFLAPMWGSRTLIDLVLLCYWWLIYKCRSKCWGRLGSWLSLDSQLYFLFLLANQIYASMVKPLSELRRCYFHKLLSNFSNSLVQVNILFLTIVTVSSFNIS